jgi:hypothetical protein
MKLTLAGIFLAHLFVSETSAAIIDVCDEPALRAAVSVGGHVRFNCNGTITLSNTLTIATNCVIDANGQGVSIDGGSRVQVLHVLPGFQVTLLNLQISGGRGTNGGGICNEGALLLSNCTLFGNTAIGSANAMTNGGPGRGGGIYNTGSLVVTNCIIATNTAIGGVGANGTNGVWSMDYFDQFGRCRSTANTPGGPAYHGGQAEGGAIFNAGTAVVVNTSFLLNRAMGGAGGNGGWGGRGGCLAVAQPGGTAGAGGRAAGAAVCNQGSLTLQGCSLVQNGASGGGGGLGGSPVGGTFVWQAAPGGRGGDGQAGAIYNSGLFTICNTTLSANHTSGGDGGAGGITVTPQFTCEPRTNGHGGDAVGGAIANYGWFAATNATLWGNLATGGTSTNQNPASTNWNCVTLPGNSGNRTGSTIAAMSGYLALANTIVANPALLDTCAGPVSDGGYNICSDGSAAFTAQGSMNNTDPRLAPLGKHGGITWTHPLFPGSPALNNGPVDSCPAIDQRGVSRPQRSRCDIGAYEQSFLTLALGPSGNIRIEFSWVPFESCRLQSSPDLITWADVEAGTADSNGRVEFTVPGTATRLFRISVPD